MSLTLLLFFAASLLIGAPVAVSLGLSAGLVIFLYDLPFTVMAQRAINTLDSTPLLAVPLFILAASLLGATGVTTHLFELMRMVVGRIRGGMAHVNVLTSLIFSGMSGAALADIGALGGIQIRQMEQQGYTKRFAAGLTIAAATIGPIFPPSIPLIIFATAAEVSTIRALLAGVVPALVVAIALMVQVAVMARHYKLPRDDAQPSFKAFRKKTLISLPALLAPVLLVGGMVSGFFGPTEAAGMTTAYAILIGLAIYRSLTWRSFLSCTRETVLSTANVLFVVASAALFAWVLTMDRVPAHAGEWLLSVSDNPLVLLLLLNVLLLVVGMFLEAIVAILIIAPIVAPALLQAGVPAEQLGVVFVLNLMLGLLTPPVGMSLYMVSIITKMPLSSIIRGVAPFYLSLFAALAAVTLIPALSTWLPNLVM